MRRNRVAIFFLSLLTASCTLCGVSALAATPLAITAANLTMPADDPPTTSDGVTAIHMGSSQFTVTGVGEGTVTIGCQYSGAVTQARIPQTCGIAGPGQVPVQAGETTLSGTVYFVPYGEGPLPGLAQLRSVPSPSSRLPATALALAAALMLGFGFRRRARRALLLAALAACTLVGAAGITACSEGNSNTMTPGTYRYTISAGFTEAGGNAIQTATTTITLTVK
ncbi:MAG TPA: hypothetical protein VMD29_07130 [Terracidiphilus sp.]|nr:hypothetical protein [Terracidiphilus sp.]